MATLNGQISFFDAKSSAQTGTIEGRADLGSGRSDTDLITAKKSLQGKSFLTLCYSADGTCILAGGQSKNICIYHVKERLLVKKFELTQNRSFDAMDEVISRKKMTEFGNMALVEDRDDSLGSQQIRDDALQSFGLIFTAGKRRRSMDQWIKIRQFVCCKSNYCG